ncbi:MAG: hypothetical protein AVDCRST_MAG30-2869, partial [uncultured Solirubrobacteraceae bacterium]
EGGPPPRGARPGGLWSLGAGGASRADAVEDVGRDHLRSGRQGRGGGADRAPALPVAAAGGGLPRPRPPPRRLRPAACRTGLHGDLRRPGDRADRGHGAGAACRRRIHPDRRVCDRALRAGRGGAAGRGAV